VELSGLGKGGGRRWWRQEEREGVSGKTMEMIRERQTIGRILRARKMGHSDEVQTEGRKCSFTMKRKGRKRTGPVRLAAQASS
jgi:hypothetical protein